MPNSILEELLDLEALFDGTRDKYIHAIEEIQNDAKIWQILNKFSKTSQVVEIKNVPILGDLITEIFIQ